MSGQALAAAGKTEKGTCPRNLWYTSHGTILRMQGWRLRKVPPKWDADNALIERAEGAATPRGGESKPRA